MRVDQSYIQRRRFLGGMVCGGVAALGATAAVPLAPYVASRHREPVPDFQEYDQADWHTAPGQSRIVRYGPLPVLIVAAAADGHSVGGHASAAAGAGETEAAAATGTSAALRVFLATCTHLDCIVGYQPEQQCILCACHEGRFDLDGQVISGPPPAPLARLHYEVRGDRLVLALEKHHLETSR